MFSHVQGLNVQFWILINIYGVCKDVKMVFGESVFANVQMQKVLKNNPKVYNFTLTYRLMISLNVLSWWILILK